MMQALSNTEHFSNTRLRLGDYFADVLPDRKEHSLVHWTVQKIASCEIVSSGQERTFGEALNAARASLQRALRAAARE